MFFCLLNRWQSMQGPCTPAGVHGPCGAQLRWRRGRTKDRRRARRRSNSSRRSEASVLPRFRYQRQDGGSRRAANGGDAEPDSTEPCVRRRPPTRGPQSDSRPRRTGAPRCRAPAGVRRASSSAGTFETSHSPVCRGVDMSDQSSPRSRGCRRIPPTSPRPSPARLPRRSAGVGSGYGSARGCRAARSPRAPIPIARPRPWSTSCRRRGSGCRSRPAGWARVPPADVVGVDGRAGRVRCGARCGRRVGRVRARGDRPVRGGRPPRGRGRLEADPADALEVQLRPGVHVVHPDACTDRPCRPDRAGSRSRPGTGCPAMRAISAIPVANCSQYPDLFSSRKSRVAFIPLPRAFSVL